MIKVNRLIFRISHITINALPNICFLLYIALSRKKIYKEAVYLIARAKQND